MTQQKKAHVQHKSQLASIQARADEITTRINAARTTIEDGLVPQQQVAELKVKRRNALAALFLGKQKMDTVELDAAIADAEQRSSEQLLTVEAAEAAIELLRAEHQAVMLDFAAVAKESRRLQWEAIQAELVLVRPQYEAAAKAMADAYARAVGIARAADSLLTGQGGNELPQRYAAQLLPFGFQLPSLNAEAFDGFQSTFDLTAQIEAVKLATLAEIA
jgi:hypothetical protein